MNSFVINVVQKNLLIQYWGILSKFGHEVTYFKKILKRNKIPVTYLARNKKINFFGQMLFYGYLGGEFYRRIYCSFRIFGEEQRYLLLLPQNTNLRRGKDDKLSF